MTLMLTPMPNPQSFHPRVPWQLHARVQAYGRAETPLPLNCARIAIGTGCAATEHRPEQGARRARGVNTA